MATTAKRKKSNKSCCTCLQKNHGKASSYGKVCGSVMCEIFIKRKSVLVLVVLDTSPEVVPSIRT